jgi:ribose transport system substrate-binding protein
MKRIASITAVCAGLAGLAGTALAAGVDELPADIQSQLYNKDAIDPQQPIGPSAYRDWKPKKGPPWTIGYASSYAGNTWRAAALEHLEKDLIPKWKKLGLIKDVIVTQSNLKDSVQIQQMRQLVDRGVDALIICCSNPTALNETVKYAYDKGVPTFSMVGYVTSPYAINSSTNFVVTGKKIGEWLVNEIGKKGDVLVVEGIPGTSTSDSLDRGMKLGLATSPDVKIVGDVAGMWTDQVAQAEVQKWLRRSQRRDRPIGGRTRRAPRARTVGPQDAACRDRR